MMLGGIESSAADRASARPVAGQCGRRHLLSRDVDEGVFGQNGRLRRLRSFVDEHYPEPIDLDTAARVALMEKCAFSRFFSSQDGVPYINWLTRFRLEQALDLIESRKTVSVTEVAFAVGFSSLRSFQRSFKRYLGVTPFEMKKTFHAMKQGGKSCHGFAKKRMKLDDPT